MLNLPPDLAQRLTEEAARQGLSVELYALQLLSRQVPVEERRDQVVSLLQSWMDAADAAEQQETGEYLVRVLDEDRFSDRQLFPPELKGVTW
jgi:plasmid stability protein